MRKKCLMIAAVIMGLTAGAMAQNIYYYNSNGSFAGRSSRGLNGTTFHYNSNGGFAGRSSRGLNGTTFHYNSNGGLIGTTTTRSW